MKRLLLILLFPILAYSRDHLRSEQRQVEKELWRQEQTLGLTNVYFNIHVRRLKDMVRKNVWGDLDLETHEIEILATEDFPNAMPRSARDRFQKEIVKHEVLHIKLKTMGVPDEAQDDIIEGLRPAIK